MSRVNIGNKTKLLFVISFCISIISCDENKNERTVTKDIPKDLMLGKTTWEANCKLCHEPGLAHAPKVGDIKEWQKRLKKGEAQLVRNAIEGFNEMPPRGANESLSDKEVTQAVKYMIFVSS